MKLFGGFKMNMIILDFSKIKTDDEMHQLLKDTFHFPEFYGRNWDAFWDMLYDYIDRSCIVKIMGLKQMPDELKEDSEIMLRIFNRILKKFSSVSVIVE
jgi:RNAse (barnase) inhibitor barstar